MKQTASQDQGAVSQWVTFRLDDESYGLDVMQVQEVLRMTEVVPVPGAPQYVLGIINLRGNVVTVIDARMRLGLPPRESDDASRIIVVDIHDKVIGMRVDSVADVAYIERSQIEPPPNVGNEEATRFILGVTHRDDEMLILIDLKKFLTSGQWKELAAL